MGKRVKQVSGFDYGGRFPTYYVNYGNEEVSVTNLYIDYINGEQFFVLNLRTNPVFIHKVLKAALQGVQHSDVPQEEIDMAIDCMKTYLTNLFKYNRQYRNYYGLIQTAMDLDLDYHDYYKSKWIYW